MLGELAIEQSDDFPVGNVSWNDAVAFCEWLSKKEGRNYRLPTEAEWEYACRAGSQTAYFFGDNPRQLLQYAHVGKQTRPMGQLKHNPWGLYNMYGNQWQWTADWYASDYYLKSPKEDPTGPASGITRVMRGGSPFMPASALSFGLSPRYPRTVVLQTPCRLSRGVGNAAVTEGAH